MRVTTRIGRKLGFIGIVLGAWSGFLLRDEYIYPTNEKIKELEESFIENSRKIEAERSLLNKELLEIEKKEKEMKLERELKRKQKKKAEKKLNKSNNEETRKNP